MTNYYLDLGIQFLVNIDNMQDMISSSVNPYSVVPEVGTDSTTTSPSPSTPPSTSTSPFTSTNASESQTQTQTQTQIDTQTDNQRRASSTGVLQSSAREAGDSAIMAASIAGGSSLARKVPSLAGKAGVMVGSVILGTAAVSAKNLSGNFTQYIGKPYVSNKLVSISTSYDNLNTYLMQFYNLTDDYLLSFLKLVSITHQLQWFFVLMIGYYAILLYVPIEKLESFYHRFLPKRIAEVVIKSIRAVKKSGLIIIILMYILLLASMYLGDYNLNMVMEHYEDLCQHHVNLKSKD
jgi:hypothetical protein